MIEEKILAQLETIDKRLRSLETGQRAILAAQQQCNQMLAQVTLQWADLPCRCGKKTPSAELLAIATDGG